jgi:hypothetical protein
MIQGRETPREGATVDDRGAVFQAARAGLFRIPRVVIRRARPALALLEMSFAEDPDRFEARAGFSAVAAGEP